MATAEFVTIEAGVLQMELERGDLLGERQLLLQRNAELERALAELRRKLAEAEHTRRLALLQQEELTKASAQRQLRETEAEQYREALHTEQLAALETASRQATLAAQQHRLLLARLTEENSRLKDELESARTIKSWRTDLALSAPPAPAPAPAIGYPTAGLAYHTATFHPGQPISRAPVLQAPPPTLYVPPAPYPDPRYAPPMYAAASGFGGYDGFARTHVAEPGAEPEALRTLVQAHQREREAWRRDVQGLEATLSRLQGNLTAMVPLEVARAREAELQQQCASLHGRAQQAELEADRIAADLAAASAELAGLQQDAQHWRSKCEYSEQRLSTHHRDLAAIRAEAAQSVEEIQRQAERNRSELLRLKEQLAVLQADRNSKQTELATLHHTYRSQLGDTERRCIDISRRKDDEVTRLESEVQSLQTQLRRSEEYNRGLHVAVEDLKTKCVSLGTTISGLDPVRSRSSSRSANSRSAASSPYTFS